MAEQEYLSIKEVAERIGLGYEATRKKLADDYPDRIPSLGFVGADGKTRRRIPVEGFEEWLRAHESGGSVTNYPNAKLMYAKVQAAQNEAEGYHELHIKALATIREMKEQIEALTQKVWEIENDAEEGTCRFCFGRGCGECVEDYEEER